MYIKNVWGRSDWFLATFQKNGKIYQSSGKTFDEVIVSIYEQVRKDIAICTCNHLMIGSCKEDYKCNCKKHA
jgi:hypothetical protein